MMPQINIEPVRRGSGLSGLNQSSTKLYPVSGQNSSLVNIPVITEKGFIQNPHKQKMKHLIFKEDGIHKNIKKEINGNNALKNNQYVKKHINQPMSSKNASKSTFFQTKQKKEKPPHKTLEENFLLDFIKQFHEDDNFDKSPTSHFLQTSTNKNWSTKKQSILEGHDIQEDHRARMIDWMVQVFRVLRVSCDQTLFLAVEIMDRYFFEEQSKNQRIERQDLHLIGLTSIFISSKYEDVIPIHMHQILNDAGHGKFQRDQVLNMEKQIFQSLKFQVHSITLFEESFTRLRLVLYDYQSYKLSDQEKKDLDHCLTFYSKLVMHNLEFSDLNNKKDMSIALVAIALRRQIQEYQNKDSLSGGSISPIHN